MSGNVRFVAETTEAGHADDFWAHALALHAAKQPANRRNHAGNDGEDPLRPNSSNALRLQGQYSHHARFSKGQEWGSSRLRQNPDEAEKR